MLFFELNDVLLKTSVINTITNNPYVMKWNRVLKDIQDGYV